MFVTFQIGETDVLYRVVYIKSIFAKCQSLGRWLSFCDNGVKMKILVIVLLFLAAHFNATPFAPAPAGTAKFYWPFATDSKPWLGFIGGLPASGGVVTSLLAGVAALGFVAALLALFGWLVPAHWFAPAILAASIASVLLYVLYFGAFSLLPLALDAILLVGVYVWHWSVAGLK